MRGYEALGLGLALLLVPMLAWIAGRSAGRRDMGAVGVIVVVLVAALVAFGLALAASSAIEASVAAKGAFQVILERRLRDAGSFPEFLAFLGVFGIFVGMVGWSSVPAAKPSGASVR